MVVVSLLINTSSICLLPVNFGGVQFYPSSDLAKSFYYLSVLVTQNNTQHTSIWNSQFIVILGLQKATAQSLLHNL